MKENMNLLMENWRKFVNEAENPAEKQEKSSDPASLAQNLNNAFNQGPAAVRAFLNTPEGKSEAVRDILKSGLKDGSTKDDVVKVSGPNSISVSDLIPTQNFIDLMQSISFPLGSSKGFLNAVVAKKGFGTIVVDGKLIIDGHHRWSGVYAIARDGTINALNVNWPGKDTKEKLGAAQLSIGAYVGANKEQPSAGGEPKTNILGKKSPEIEQMIMSNVNKQTDPKAPGALLNDNMMKEIVAGKDSNMKPIYDWAGIAVNVTDINQLRKAIAKKIGDNLSQIKSNSQAPARPDMPQFDTSRGGPELNTIVPNISKGEFNIAPPYNVQKESLRNIIRQVIRENLKRK